MGDVSICKTDKHHCTVDNMLCGHTYTIKVLAEDEACNSSYSPTQQITAGMLSSELLHHIPTHIFFISHFHLNLSSVAPCPLTDFLTSLDCNTGIVSVSWNESSPEVVHTVSAVDAAGHQHNCSGTISSCDLITLSCGTMYNVSITPSRNGCVGRDSPTKVITTGKEEFKYNSIHL